MKDYRYFLALSSQFPFCGIPLRLDSHSRCQFSCRYCFASARGGAGGSRGLRVADPDRLARRLDGLNRRPPQSALDELLAKRIPIHFGGMSDPFSPMEVKTRTTLSLLRILLAHKYPTILSTKGTLALAPEYLDVLRAENFVVQYSVTCLNDVQSAAIDFGAPVTSERLSAVEHLSRAGVKTAVRHQPMLPAQGREGENIVRLASAAGARHISVEYLKLPIELDWRNRVALNQAAGLDLVKFYSSRHSLRVGREWVLPVSDRLPIVLRLKRLSNSLGMTFGAADTDLLHFSDGNVCCSGADLFNLGQGFSFNFLGAVQLGIKSNRISIGKLVRAWRPQRSISQFVNSHSRLDVTTLEEFIRLRWNGVNNGPSPLMFHGVFDSDQRDRDGFRIYKMTEDARELHRTSRISPPSNP